MILGWLKASLLVGDYVLWPDSRGRITSEVLKNPHCYTRGLPNPPNLSDCRLVGN